MIISAASGRHLIYRLIVTKLLLCCLKFLETQSLQHNFFLLRSAFINRKNFRLTA